MNVSIITLTVISIDRYFAVIHPLRPRCSRRVATCVMMVVWGFSVASAVLPLVLYRVDYIPENKNYICRPWTPFTNDTNSSKLIQLLKGYNLYLVTIQYFLPLMIIVFAYLRIMHTIWFTKTPGSAVDTRDQMVMKNKRKVRHQCPVSNPVSYGLFRYAHKAYQISPF